MKKNDINKLEKIIEELRSEKGCPWDRDLKLEKLSQLTIEESYELLDAVEKKDNNKIIDELSDLLTHMIFYFQIGDSLSQYNKETVIEHAINKLIERHPHVFDETYDKKFSSAEEVEQNWKSLKKKSSDTSNDLNFNGPSGITAERLIKTLIELDIKFDEKEILDNLSKDPKNSLFFIYFLMIQRGESPEIEFRNKLEEIKKEIRKLEKKDNSSLDKLDKSKIKQILFPDSFS